MTNSTNQRLSNTPLTQKSSSSARHTKPIGEGDAKQMLGRATDALRNPGVQATEIIQSVLLPLLNGPFALPDGSAVRQDVAHTILTLVPRVRAENGPEGGRLAQQLIADVQNLSSEANTQYH